jgi:hypothetical protein
MTPRDLTRDEELLSGFGTSAEAITTSDSQWLREIDAEFSMGFEAMAGIGDAVTVFGSARTSHEHPEYALGRELGTSSTPTPTWTSRSPSSTSSSGRCCSCATRRRS